jgi:hypothetical protein
VELVRIKNQSRVSGMREQPEKWRTLREHPGLTQISLDSSSYAIRGAVMASWFLADGINQGHAVVVKSSWIFTIVTFSPNQTCRL